MGNQNLTFHKYVLFSPMLIIGAGYLTVIASGGFLREWVWIPLVLVLWSLFALVIYWSGGWKSVNKWLSSRDRSIGWPLFAVSVGLIPLPPFLHKL